MPSTPACKSAASIYFCTLVMANVSGFRTDVYFRFASPEDAELVAPLNAQLIRDEGHRNPMSVPQLADRIRTWLKDEYQAVLFESRGSVVGYALFRKEPEFIYLRQLFVSPEVRRQGIARSALTWLWKNAWLDAQRLRIDVLVGNSDGREFWSAVGFRDYCMTMEMEQPHAR